MGDLWFPASIAVVAVLSTYFFCLRPMRQGGDCRMSRANREHERLDQELAELHASLASTTVIT